MFAEDGCSTTKIKDENGNDYNVHAKFWLMEKSDNIKQTQITAGIEEKKDLR